MRYSIGFLIRGEAAEYYKATCEDLATRFGITDVSRVVPPRITIKSPFEYSRFENLEKLVAPLAQTKPLPFSLNGWNYFGTKTAFVDVPEPSQELKDYLNKILNAFKAQGMIVTPQEYRLHLHLSVARFLTPETFEKVTQYLQTIPAPQFDMNLDNLTIFAQDKDSRTWRVEKTFPILG